MKKLFQLSSILLALNLVFIPVVNSQTTLEIDYDTSEIKNQELNLDKIKVIVNYKPYDYSTESEDSNLNYQIYYDNKLKITNGQMTGSFANVSLQDLDADNIPEVIVRTYSGGAHCCTNHFVYFWQENQQEFKQIETGFSDGGGGTFQDLDNDGKFEFITYDNSFLYAFSSYAGSFPPSLILRLENGEFKNVTRNYPKYLRSTAWDMYKVIQENEFENGVLAGYVAQKILLGEYEEGWKFMLANYDKQSDWGLEIYDENNNQIGAYPDFPTALKVFLIETGYLDKQGKPISK